jgi:hypothetical protein
MATKVASYQGAWMALGITWQQIERAPGIVPTVKCKRKIKENQKHMEQLQQK